MLDEVLHTTSAFLIAVKIQLIAKMIHIIRMADGSCIMAPAVAAVVATLVVVDATAIIRMVVALSTAMGTTPTILGCFHQRSRPHHRRHHLNHLNRLSYHCSHLRALIHLSLLPHSRN